MKLGSLERPAWPWVDLVCAGFPCQAFSRSMQVGDHTDHESYPVCLKLVNIVRKSQARAFVFENVTGFFTKAPEMYHRLIKEMTDLGFVTQRVVLDAQDFGVPQQRKRMFIMGVKGAEFSPRPEMPVFEKPVCIRDILEDSTVL
jgi:site-specific DNA-cytosine methylase